MADKGTGGLEHWDPPSLRLAPRDWYNDSFMATVLAKTYAQQALAHLAWRRNQSGERRLIFGFLEILPAAMPAMRGHPFKSHEVRSAERTYVYVARFPMSANDGERWYDQAVAGTLRLPRHPDKSSAGDGCVLASSPTLAEPEGGGESMSMELPFLPARQGLAYVRGLFPSGAEVDHFELQDEKTAEWLAGELSFDLRDSSSYLGALLRVRYGRRLRAVERHLVPRPDGDDELVRLTTWPGEDITGAEIIAVEHRPLGWSEIRRIPIDNPVMRIAWPRRVGQTGLAIYHPEDGLCWWSDVSPFVRAIGLNIEMPGLRRRVVVEGKTKEVYEVTERVPIRDAPVVVGELQDPLSVSARFTKAKISRERREISARLGVQWFDDPATAASAIRGLIGKARNRVWIIDPYFAGEEVVRFALAVTSPRTPVEVITSAEYLRDDDGGAELSDAFERVLAEVKQHVAIIAKVMPGRAAPLHDRFLVIDDSVWFSGNSLNRIGERASVLIEMPDPDAVLQRLAPIRDAAVPFEGWIEERRAMRQQAASPGWLKRILKSLRATR